MTIGVGTIGTGWIMPFHARAVAAHAGARLVAAANHREESRARFADAFDIPRRTVHWQDLADDPDIDAVVIGTPNALHAPQAIELLSSGKHVLVEKPMATIVAAAEAMIAAADAADVRLMVGHNWRFHDDVRRLRDRITAGDLGEVVKTRGYGTHVAWGPSGWFTNPALAGGGALLDMGVHAIDTARFLIGDPDPVDVCATVATRYAAGRYAVDDDGILVIRWSSGVRSIVECGWWQPHRGGLEADTEVYGTRGYARIWPASDASLSEADDDHCSQPMYTAQMHEFLSAIEEDREPVPGPANGLAVMRVVEDAYRSADLRQGPPA